MINLFESMEFDIKKIREVDVYEMRLTFIEV
jgi:hypothetical protein